MGDRTSKAQPGRDWPDGLADWLLSLVVDLTCVAGFDGKFRELSDGWQDLLGYSSQELLDRPFLELIHQDRAPVDHVNIHDGLNNTLIALQGKLRGGVEPMARFQCASRCIPGHGFRNMRGADKRPDDARGTEPIFGSWQISRFATRSIFSGATRIRWRLPSVCRRDDLHAFLSGPFSS